MYFVTARHVTGRDLCAEVVSDEPPNRRFLFLPAGDWVHYPKGTPMGALYRRRRDENPGSQSTQREDEVISAPISTSAS